MILRCIDRFLRARSVGTIRPTSVGGCLISTYEEPTMLSWLRNNTTNFRRCEKIENATTAETERKLPNTHNFSCGFFNFDLRTMATLAAPAAATTLKARGSCQFEDQCTTNSPFVMVFLPVKARCPHRATPRALTVVTAAGGGSRRRS